MIECAHGAILYGKCMKCEEVSPQALQSDNFSSIAKRVEQIVSAGGSIFVHDKDFHRLKGKPGAYVGEPLVFRGAPVHSDARGFIEEGRPIAAKEGGDMVVFDFDELLS